MTAGTAAAIIGLLVAFAPGALIGAGVLIVAGIDCLIEIMDNQ
jgi:hypothetical protein